MKKRTNYHCATARNNLFGGTLQFVSEKRDRFYASANFTVLAGDWIDFGSFGHKLSLQNALNRGFKALGRIFQVPTASAYCQARQKINSNSRYANNSNEISHLTS